jgi:hypothetical protein
MKSLRVFYDVRSNPLTWDFANFIAHCWYLSVEAGSLLRLSVIAPSFRRTNDIEMGYSDEYLMRRLSNIFMPAAQLSKIFEEISFAFHDDDYYFESRVPDGYATKTGKYSIVSASSTLPLTYNSLIQMFNKTGVAPIVFNCPNHESKNMGAHLISGAPMITITLRNTPHNPQRNCSAADLYDLYSGLKLLGLEVVVIPDQDDFFGSKSYQSFDWQVSEAACLDYRYRFALYSSSDLNIGWTSGVFAPLMLSKVPFLTFGVFNERSGVSNRNFFDRKGPPFGSQLPWSGRRQFIDWTEASKVTPKYMLETTTRLLNNNAAP